MKRFMEANKLKYILYSAIIIIISLQSLQANEAGRLLSVNGLAERTSILSGEIRPCKSGAKLFFYERIKTSKNSSANLLLHDGILLVLKPDSSIILFSIKKSNTEPPSKIKLEYGKSIISSIERYKGIAAVLSTPTSEIDIISSEFAILASSSETRLYITKGSVQISGVFSQSRRVIKKNETALINRTGLIEKKFCHHHEKFVSWISRYSLNKIKTRLIINRTRRKTADWILLRDN